MTHNLILDTDSYKASHYLQYPPDTTHLSAYIESRGGYFPQTLFFGLQLFLKRYLCNPITTIDIREAQEIITQHGLPFNRSGWEYIVKNHGGYLPLAIEAVPEGTLVPLHNVLVQLVNTDPACAWLTTYLETALLRGIWYPTTVATLSWHCKKIMRDYLLETADTLDSLPQKLHDFGARGVSSYESAEIGGIAHLVNFAGTDTLAAILAAKQFYQKPMAAYSIPAAEHSTIMTWGDAHETEAYQHILQTFAKKNQAISIVSDSYDLWHALQEIWGQQLQPAVKKNPGLLIIRPDSGDPATIVIKVLEILMEKFGSYENSKGYRVLPNNLRVLQGDSVNLTTIESCLQAMKQKNFSAENIAFGMGGALLQKVDRDTQEFAMKVNAIQRQGKWQDVYKRPITALGKTSKPGRLALIQIKGAFKTIRQDQLANQKNQLVPIYCNGELLKDWDFDEIRKRSEMCLE